MAVEKVRSEYFS